MARTESSRTKVFTLIAKDKPGVEIGPLHNAFAPKRDGFRVTIVDHASTADLRAKYTGHGFDLAIIEDVDVVLRDGTFADQIPPASAAWVIASHVIEHTTDLIGFLGQCEKVLAPGGVLSLVVPDMRACFDIVRTPTSTGDLLLANLHPRATHDPGTVFDHFSRAMASAHRLSWSINEAGTFEKLNFVHPFDYARERFEAAQRDAGYIDVHHWRFTPSSFRLALLELRALGRTSFAEAAFFDTRGDEFHVTLRKDSGSAAVSDAERFALLKKMHLELADAYGRAAYRHVPPRMAPALRLAWRTMGSLRRAVRRALPVTGT